MADSQRKIKTMEFFNMLNEPERSQAIENYDVNHSLIIPTNLRESLIHGFNWVKTKQGVFHWDLIVASIDNKTYNFKTEPMEQQSEIDYQISVMQSDSNGSEIELTPLYEDFKDWGLWLPKDKHHKYDWVHFNYRVKPEPPEPKTVHFSFEDADFLLGLKVRKEDKTAYGMIVGLDKKSIHALFSAVNWEYTKELEYQDRTTLEWKPFVKVIE